MAPLLARLGPSAAREQEINDFESRQAERELRARARECWERAGVPPIFAGACLEDARRVPEDSIERYRSAVRRLSAALCGRGLYALIGRPGPGKTHLACALIREYCRRGHSARLVKAADYIRDYRDRWKSAEMGAEAAFERVYVGFRLLVIDEWQARNDTENENVLLFRLLDKRYEADRATVLIGNHESKADFERSIDARIADRICDAGGIILCDWPSLRGRLKQEAGT